MRGRSASAQGAKRSELADFLGDQMNPKHDIPDATINPIEVSEHNTRLGFIWSQGYGHRASAQHIPYPNAPT